MKLGKKKGGQKIDVYEQFSIVAENSTIIYKNQFFIQKY
jgi:hypothetical protein